MNWKTKFMKTMLQGRNSCLLWKNRRKRKTKPIKNDWNERKIKRFKRKYDPFVVLITV